jgi:two-component system, NarL family, invasion response regulator UvrY
VIRILIADDHPVVRRGLKEILVHHLEGVVCGEAENAQQVLSEVRRHSWDLLILDISMPGRSGFDILGDLKQLQLDISVRTAESHHANIMAKLNVQSLAYLVRIAFRDGVT